MITNHAIEPEFSSAVSANFGYGLEVNSPHAISYSKGGVTIEVIGGITDPVAQNLRVTLKIYKTGTTNPLEIYRSTQVDLFNETQTNFVVTQVSERLNIESLTFKNIFYDFIERLDNYRKHGQVTSIPKLKNISTSVQQEVEAILKNKNVLQALQNQLKKAGISDTKMGLQLYIISLSRITKNPIHSIIQAPILIGNALVSEMLKVMPNEQTIELTSISKHALSYAPTENYWDNKTLVLHQLESIQDKGNSLLEYLLQGKSLRLVTQADTQTGMYLSQQKNVTESISLLAYTNTDYHPLFKGKQSICIPIKNTLAIQDKIYEKEVKIHAGLLDNQEQENAQEVLQQLAREIKNYDIYNPVMEQIDVSIFFGRNIQALSKYLKLVNLITLLHQKKQTITQAKTKSIIEVQPEHMIQALELFRNVFIKQDQELYFNVESTFIRLKKVLQKNYPSDYESQNFKVKTIRKELGMSPITLAKHIKTLEQYAKVERTGGNNKTGFEYTITEWNENTNNTENYYTLIEKIKEIIE